MSGKPVACSFLDTKNLILSNITHNNHLVHSELSLLPGGINPSNPFTGVGYTNLTCAVFHPCRGISSFHAGGIHAGRVAKWCSWTSRPLQAPPASAEGWDAQRPCPVMTMSNKPVHCTDWILYCRQPAAGVSEKWNRLVFEEPGECRCPQEALVLMNKFRSLTYASLSLAWCL